jgi:hypothetical protein
MKLILFVFATLIATTADSQERKPKIVFTIRFASCFKNDTVTLAINNISVFDKETTSSDFSTGITDMFVFQDEIGLHIQANNRSIVRNPIDIANALNARIEINGTTKTEMVDLKKGRIIFIDYCFRKVNDSVREKSVTLHYFKKKVNLY